MLDMVASAEKGLKNVKNQAEVDLEAEVDLARSKMPPSNLSSDEMKALKELRFIK